MVTQKRDIFSIIGLIFECIYALQSIGILPFPLPFIGAIGFLVNYYSILALLVGTSSTLWVGYRVAVWRMKLLAQRAIPSTPHSARQLKYRAQVRDDLARIRGVLYKEERQPVQFESWNAFPKPDTRHSDIHNDAQFDAIQNFSTFLNKRNNHLNDAEFQWLNDECIARYVKVRETGFLDADKLVATIESYEDAIAKAEPVTYYPIIGTRRPYHRQTILDPTRLHLHAYMFFGLSYYIPILSKLAGKHRDLYAIPRKELIVNTDTMAAYHIDEYVMPLLWPIVQIRWESRFYLLFSRLERWCKKNGFAYHPWGAGPNDLKGVLIRKARSGTS